MGRFDTEIRAGCNYIYPLSGTVFYKMYGKTTDPILNRIQLIIYISYFYFLSQAFELHMITLVTLNQCDQAVEPLLF